MVHTILERNLVTLGSLYTLEKLPIKKFLEGTLTLPEGGVPGGQASRDLPFESSETSNGDVDIRRKSKKICEAERLILFLNFSFLLRAKIKFLNLNF